MWYCYLITNLVNKKIYVGKGKSLQARWQQHKMIAKGGPDKYPKRYQYLHKAIAKYSNENFEICALSCHELEKDAFQAEKDFIAKYRASDYHLYNLTDGGEGSSGCKRSKESNEKNRIAHLGKRHTDESKKLMSLVRKNTSKETRRKLSLKKIGDNHPRSKLTWDKVNQIRSLAAQNVSQKELSVQFGVNISTISSIIRHKTWC